MLKIIDVWVNLIRYSHAIKSSTFTSQITFWVFIFLVVTKAFVFAPQSGLFKLFCSAYDLQKAFLLLYFSRFMDTKSIRPTDWARSPAVEIEPVWRSRIENARPESPVFGTLWRELQMALSFVLLSWNKLKTFKNKCLLQSSVMLSLPDEAKEVTFDNLIIM